MADIALHKERDDSAVSVANTFIDNYMASANGEYVKLYLYLLRCMDSPNRGFSVSKAADSLENTAKDINRALQYWEKVKLLRLEYDEEKRLSGITLQDAKSEEAPIQIQEQVPVPLKELLPANSKRPQFTTGELAAFKEKEEVQELILVAESYLKRILSPADLNRILYWFDELKFSADLIEYLMEYCLGKDHASLLYMDKVALAWKEQDISTVEEAKQSTSAFNKLHFAVLRAFGISGRNLNDSELAYAEKWRKNYGFSQELILEACRRTITKTHQPSFEYADKILEQWKKQQVKGMGDVEKLDAAFRTAQASAGAQKKNTAGSERNNKFNNFPQRDYDYARLEQRLAQ